MKLVMFLKNFVVDLMLNIQLKLVSLKLKKKKPLVLVLEELKQLLKIN